MVKRQKEINVEGITEAGPVRTQVFSRHRKGLMSVIQVVGLPGTGKSWACIRLGELISQDIHGENRVNEDNIQDSLIGILKFIMGVKKKGEILIIEEASVLFSSRRSMSRENVNAGRILDTLRKKGVILIMNFPIQKDVDSKLSRLASMTIQTLRLNKRKGICISKPLRLQTNPSSGKTYKHRLKKKGREVHRIWTGLPLATTTDAYELKKDEFLKELYGSLLSQEKADKAKAEMKIAKLTQNGGMPIITKIEARVMDLLNTGMTHRKVAEVIGSSKSNVSGVKARFLRKTAEINALLQAQESK